MAAMMVRQGLRNRSIFQAAFAVVPVRHLNLHEDQSKALMQKYNVKVTCPFFFIIPQIRSWCSLIRISVFQVQNFRSAETAAEAEKYAADLRQYILVVSMLWFI